MLGNNQRAKPGSMKPSGNPSGVMGNKRKPTTGKHVNSFQSWTDSRGVLHKKTAPTRPASGSLAPTPRPNPQRPTPGLSPTQIVKTPVQPTVSIIDQQGARALYDDYQSEIDRIRAQAAALGSDNFGQYRTAKSGLFNDYSQNVWDDNARLAAGGMLGSGSQQANVNQRFGEYEGGVTDLAGQLGGGAVKSLQSQEAALRSEMMRQLLALFAGGASSVYSGGA